MPEKSRLDARLVSDALVESRQRARALILEGVVFVNGQRVDKVAHSVAADAQIEVRGAAIPYVSRGGLKLEKALATFPLSLSERVCMDVGASTGGFTDVMLQNGAKKVYSLDVGYGQLAWKLRTDLRVVVMERQNARNMQGDWFDETPDFAGMDVSFISIGKILPAMYSSLAGEADVVTLIKPQFEAGREKVGKNGVVRDAATHIEVIANSMRTAREVGFDINGLTFSPITGPKGNIEFLLYLTKGKGGAWAQDDDEIEAVQCVESVHFE